MLKKSVKANRFNIKRMVYCKVLTDDSSGTTYDAVKDFGDAMQIQLTPGVSRGTLYGFGVKKENISRLNGITAAVDVNKVYPEVRADVYGNQIVEGIVIEASDDEAPYIALGFEIEQTGKKNEYVWLLKGQAQPINTNVQQSTENIVFSTDSMTIDFIPRESDSLIRFFGDASYPDFTQAQIDKWFLSGPSKYPTNP